VVARSESKPAVDRPPSEPLVGGETVFYKDGCGAARPRPRAAAASRGRGGKAAATATASGADADALAAVVTPTAGLALLHAHGARCLLHEGAAVRAGVKYLLRTDVVYG
jgi:hypothetical protein